MIDTELLAVMVCPVSKGKLTANEATQELFCRTSQLAFPVRDGIPVMLETEARKLSAEELANTR